MPEPSRILIVRLSALGDTVLALPVLCALRAARPESHLAWLVEDRFADLLRGHPALDELITVRRGYLKSARAVWQLRSRLRHSRFDVALDVQGLAKSALAALWSGARRRIGFVRGELQGRELSSWLNTELVDPALPHVLEKNLELLRPLGIDRPAIEFGLREQPADAAAAEQLLGPDAAGSFAVLNVGAGWVCKQWPLDRFAAVARYLGNAQGLRCLLTWGTADDRARAEQVAALSLGHAAVLPRISLPVLAAVFRRARLVVSCDTGPLHLAAAVGAHCVALYGPTPSRRIGVYGPVHVRLQNVPQQSSSGRRRSTSNELMLAISIADACRACEAVLSRPVQPAGPVPRAA